MKFDHCFRCNNKKLISSGNFIDHLKCSQCSAIYFFSIMKISFGRWSHKYSLYCNFNEKICEYYFYDKHSTYRKIIFPWLKFDITFEQIQLYITFQ